MGRAVPGSFRFVLKGRQKITHFQLLKDSESDTDEFLGVASLLNDRLGAILFQLPPTFRKNVERLDVFLKHIAGRVKVAFEFRNETWLDNEVYDCLRTHSAALAVTDRDDLPETGLVHTANWGYVRLSRDNYSHEQLRVWLEGIRSQKWVETYVIFVHKDDGMSPKLAAKLTRMAGA